MLNRKLKPIAAAVGAAFAVSLAAGAAADVSEEANVADPFETQVLDGVLFADAHKEGGCGEDAEKPEGDEEADAEGDGDKAEGEGKCGEGNCGEGEDKEKSDGDDEES